MAVSTQEFESIARLEQFDHRSGNAVERLLFNHRGLIVLLCALVTAALAFSALRVQLNASFLKTIPNQHPYVLNFLKYENEVKGLGNAVRIVVEAAPDGDIFTPDYVGILKAVNDEVYLLPGVDRAFMKSLWMPAVRWIGVTDEGYEGGPVMPEDYDGSAASIAAFRDNVLRSGEIGQLVAPDFRSSIIYVPLVEQAGQRLDYGALSDRLEDIRTRYEARGVHLRITGFAKVMGDLIAGLYAILAFFAFALVVTALILYVFTRCLRSTLLVIATTMIGIVWLIGFLPLLGFELNPYSILVPFLIFAIGVSHGAQKMNGIMQDIGRGTHKLIAARYTFRRLFVAGATALLADVVGFAVLTIIDIPVIRELALIASLGVGILIFTNLALLPILLSYTGVSPRAAERSLREERATDTAAARKHGLWRFLDLFTRRGPAAWAIGVALVLGVGGFLVSKEVKIGDLDAGAPELRADSRYNIDNDFLVRNYQAGSDVFVVFGRTEQGHCADYDKLLQVDALEWSLRQSNVVEGTSSFAGLVRRASAGMNEGSLKWYDLVANQHLINGSAARAPRELFNATCDLLSIYAYLKDHKADSLDEVVRVVEDFVAANPSAGIRFELAAGNAGIEAATNQVVKSANVRMLLGVYVAVTLLCVIAFRSWRAVLCAVLPLVLTSILVEALMVGLGIGIKVSTLPVIALGVGIGVDYALYVLSVTQAWLRSGATLSEAYYRSLVFTGRVVIFTGCTLAIGVGAWAFSPIKFQADMGILLTFMFLWNMLGALILIPALATFLLPAARRDAPSGLAARSEAEPAPAEQPARPAPVPATAVRI
ncbi:efflux RND transporter permease subunit [Pseudothauera rhizosphaerae]|uniref:RND family transporter n=1 Tax=Pseudothauera rhizosphaerae TaxID=2565932 RepID=A0A4S4ALG3_9RHOO|nr:MMPL family transporter [Pseudothauera rhizosphaerae]THF60367.1 RND family transporter [Pseudothauera rhizosphaerae]